MFVGAVGYNYSHEDNFIMERPNGTGCWLFLLIKEAAVVTINGEPFTAPKNSFVLFSPDTAYSYRAKEKIYTDDWIYLGYENGDEERFQQLGVPADEIVPLGTIDELSQLVRFIAFEHYSPEDERTLIEAHLMEILLLKLGRLIQKSRMHSLLVSGKVAALMQLRSRIYGAPDEIPGVNGMAEALGMSCSGFQHLYKRTFGVTVMHDIIAGRMELAKQLLCATNLNIREIALRCGDTNEYGFMKRFKRCFGQTPTEFRSRI